MNFLANVGSGAPEANDNDVYLRPGDAMEIMGKRFVVESGSSNPPGFIVYDPATPDDGQKMTSASIKDLWLREKLFFISRDEFGLPIGVRESLRRSLRAFKPAERSEMVRRLRYCQKLDELGPGFGRSQHTIEPVCEALALERGDTLPHSWSTVYRWWKNWVRAGRDARALNPSNRRRGNRRSRLPEYMRTAIEKGKKDWLNLGQPHKTTSYKVVVAHCVAHHGGEDAVLNILKEDPEAYLWPEYRTFCTACNKIDRTERLVKRHGNDAARYDMYPIGSGPVATFPLERVESDFKYLRLFVVDDQSGLPLGTPYLMAAIDCYSGCVVGFDIGFDPPSYVAAARCLKHIIAYKDLSSLPVDEDGDPIVRNTYPMNGVPFQLFIDNDAAFHSKSFEMSARAIGANINYIPPGEPWKKGKIERFWLTVQTSFLDMFPGKVLRIGTHSTDYDPSADAVLSLSALKLFITKALVDVHHQDFEPDEGRLRIDLWNEGVAIHPPRPVRQHESLIELVGAYEERLAERRGIRLFGLRYNSPALATYRSGFEKDPRVVVRYDAQDISTIWVVDAEQGISFPVPCTRPDYAKGLSKHQHYVIRRHASGMTKAGRRLHLKHLLLAKVELYELGKKLIGSKRGSRTNAAIGRFLGVGRELIDEMSKAIVDQREDGYLDIGIEDAEDAARAQKDEDDVQRLIEHRRRGRPIDTPPKPGAQPVPVRTIAPDADDDIGGTMDREPPEQAKTVEAEPSSAVEPVPTEAVAKPASEEPRRRRRRDSALDDLDG